MRIGNKPVPPWSSPTLDRLVEMSAPLNTPIDPETVKQILFPEKLMSWQMLCWRESVLKRNRAWRNQNKAKVAWIRHGLKTFTLREETKRELKIELSPYGFPQDAEPVYGMLHGKPRRYKSTLDVEKAVLKVNTGTRNTLLSEIITALADCLFERCGHKNALIYRWIGELLRDAFYLDHPEVHPFSFNYKNWRIVRVHDHKRDQR